MSYAIQYTRYNEGMSVRLYTLYKIIINYIKL